MKNYLFSFIKKDLLNLDRFKHFRLESRTATRDSEVLVYGLSTKSISIIAQINELQLTLVDHHISIFDYTIPHQPSQYHYTAKLSDQKGKIYHVHVYFDKKDHILKTPHLTVDGEVTPVFPELDSILRELAVEQTCRLLGDLRCLYQNKIKSLFEKYMKLEEKLTELSLNLHSCLDAYLAILDEVIEHVGLMCHYENYHSYGKLFSRIKTSLSSSRVQKPVEPASDKDTKEESQGVQASIDESIVKTKPTKLAQARLFLHQTQGCFDSYQAKKDLNKLSGTIAQFVELHGKVHEAFFMLEDSELDLNERDLVRIQNLTAFVNNEGKKLLELCVLKDLQLELQLKSFTPKLPDNFLKLAILKDNAKLLAFLLENGDFPVNTTVVQDDLNLLHYCFVKHSTTSSKVACLSVLIKNGASTMIKHNGLPICFYLLEDPDLRVALTENCDLTISNPDFFRCLLQNLESFLLDQSEDLKKIDQVKKAIEKYRFALTNTKNFQFADSKAVQRTEVAIAKLANNFDRNEIEQIAQDSEVKILIRKINDTLKLYLETLPTAQKRQLLNKGNEFIGQIDSFLKTQSLKEVDLKKETISYYRTLLRILELKVELHEIQKELKIPHYKRALSKLRTNQAHIIEELNKVFKENPILVNLLKLTQSDTSPQDLKKQIETDIEDVLRLRDKTAALAKERNTDLKSANLADLLLIQWFLIKAGMGGDTLSKEDVSRLQNFHSALLHCATAYESMIARLVMQKLVFKLNNDEKTSSNSEDDQHDNQARRPK